MFVPCSIVGLLVPRIIWRQFPLSQDIMILALSREVCASITVLFSSWWANAFLLLVYYSKFLENAMLFHFAAYDMLIHNLEYITVLSSFSFCNQ